jgi:hypothetical protein
MVLLLAPLFDSRVDFKVFVNNITMLLRPWLQKCGNFNPPKKGATSSTTFRNGVDFGVFDPKIWVFRARVLILRCNTPGFEPPF